eukprot:4107768-Prymnesium_polylepis.1
MQCKGDGASASRRRGERLTATGRAPHLQARRTICLMSGAGRHRLQVGTLSVRCQEYEDSAHNLALGVKGRLSSLPRRAKAPFKRRCGR